MVSSLRSKVLNEPLSWVFHRISKAANAIAHVYQRLESVKLEDESMQPNLDQPPEVG